MFGFFYNNFSLRNDSILLGIGTAIVYPRFLSSIAEDTNSELRAITIGLFRFWRLCDWVLVTGILTDFLSIEFSVGTIGILTIISAIIIIIIYRMSCKTQLKRQLNLTISEAVIWRPPHT